MSDDKKLAAELELVKKNLFLAYRLVHQLKELRAEELKKLDLLIEGKSALCYEWKSILEEPPPEGVTCVLGWMESPYGSDVLGDLAYRKITSNGPIWLKSSTHDVLSFSKLGEPTHWCLAPMPPKRALQVVD